MSDLTNHVNKVYGGEAMPKVAAVTCDIETDFGGRVGTRELLEATEYGETLLSFCTEHRTPLTGFVVTALLDQHLPGIQLLREQNIELHPHSYSHDTKTYRANSAAEMARSQKEWKLHFGSTATGYRAPQGVVSMTDPDALQENGFQFDASIFPALRRNVFDYRDLPREPWIWNSGVMEIPFAATEDRSRLTLSMLKLRGKKYWSKRMNSLPSTVVIDTHLHDFFTPTSFNKLPIPMRIAYSRNRQEGFELLQWLIEQLRQQGYSFTSMQTIASDLSS